MFFSFRALLTTSLCSGLSLCIYFGRHVRRKQIALVTELGQSRVFATVVFLRRKAVAEQVFRGAVAATVVNQNLHKSDRLQHWLTLPT